MRTILLLAFFWANLDSIALACFAPPDAQPSSTEKWVKLESEPVAPHFYYRSGLAVVFISEDFIADYVTNEELQTAIRSVGPLIEHTDIFKGLILGTIQLTIIESVVAKALELGAAAVYFPDKREFVSNIKVVTRNDVCSGGRSFYIWGWVSYIGILSTTDWIS